MARWNNLSDSELDTRTVYVGAYGFRDNDTLGRVWAHTCKEFERVVFKMMRYEADVYRQDNETLTHSLDQMWYVGPFKQTVGETIADMEDSNRANEMRDDIRSVSSGYVY